MEPGSAHFDDGWTRQQYGFVDGGLHRATIRQHGREDAVTELWLDPALPDLSRHFEGRATSRFRLDINGQAGHGTGTVTAWWDGDVARIMLAPDAPRWLADRPMQGSVSFRPDGAVLLEMQRTEP